MINGIKTMDLITLRRDYKDKIIEIAKDCRVDNIRIFGSVARGEQSRDSDIDFLVHLRPDTGLGLGRMNWKLKELLGCKVDIVPDTSVHWAIKDEIMKESVPL